MLPDLPVSLLLSFLFSILKCQKMKIKIVDRKYRVGGKWVRFERMQGVQLIGYKLAIYKYELRIYLN